MAWYYILAFGLLIGFTLGYMTKDLISPEIQYKGKIKQKGQNNRIDITKEDKPLKRKKRRFLRRNK